MFAWKSWVGGLFATLLTAVGSGGALLVADPNTFNFGHDGIVHLGKVLAVVSLGAFFNYLKTHPVGGQ